jgi:hypothetical protein
MLAGVADPVPRDGSRSGQVGVAVRQDRIPGLDEGRIRPLGNDRQRRRHHLLAARQHIDPQRRRENSRWSLDATVHREGKPIGQSFSYTASVDKAGRLVTLEFRVGAGAMSCRLTYDSSITIRPPV